MTALIWGDPVHLSGTSDGLAKVRARTMEGYIEESALADQGLLEIYVIDVGQGDAVLVRTPDDKWHLIDAGVPGRDQMTGKGAANFLRWKFLEDLEKDKVTLENIIITHPDWDHYGGLLDILSGRLYDGRTFGIEVENLYHNGLARYKEGGLGKTADGEVDSFPQGYCGIQRKGTFYTELLDGKDSFQNPPHQFGDGFAELAPYIVQVPRKVCRLSHVDQYLPGYRPGESRATIRILGPILENYHDTGTADTLTDAGTGLRLLGGSESKTANGHSVTLRLDYGRSRILLAGDLNASSQRLLLSYHPVEEFSSDVAKACHHGAEDVDMGFVKAVQARASVISSGDNENYSHPRPVLMGAAARWGREAISPQGGAMAPLIYSTELARSVRLGFIKTVLVDADKDPATPPVSLPTRYIKVKLESEHWERALSRIQMATALVYGLVNVRTDGANILCATMEEKGNDFDYKTFKAGTDLP